MWFEQLTGIPETSPEEIRRMLVLSDGKLVSSANGGSWDPGTLEVVSLAELRARVKPGGGEPNRVSELVGDVRTLHADTANAGALFQVASQFNLLEMVSPDVTPEDGVGIYQNDFTQGPACAIACGAGTIYRNYFVPVRGRMGQTRDNQIDCLENLGNLLGNNDGSLWEMRNGYALASEKGLQDIHARLSGTTEAGMDHLRDALQAGIQWNSEVTLQACADGPGSGEAPKVSQIYCSALPVAYSPHPASLWERFARLVLEAAYETTILAAIDNLARNGNNILYLTLLGGGAFGNKPAWITDAIKRSLNLHKNAGLDIRIVSYGSPNPSIRQLLS